MITLIGSENKYINKITYFKPYKRNYTLNGSKIKGQRTSFICYIWILKNTLNKSYNKQHE